MERKNISYSLVLNKLPRKWTSVEFTNYDNLVTNKFAYSTDHDDDDGDYINTHKYSTK